MVSINLETDIEVEDAKDILWLDGGMNFLDRQANIDRFNKDPSHSIFLLSTR